MNTSASDDDDVRRECEQFPVRTVAVVVIVDRQERIFLVRTRRLPRHWQPPGGGVKPFDVSPDAAAVREVYEEVGIKLAISKIHKIYEAPYDFGTGVVHFFLTPAPDDCEIRANEVELAGWQWFNLEAALNLPKFPATEKCLQFLADNKRMLSEVARESR
jgi:8-oxo-dGTP pyrophosphatase MutT (NUDIX family)